MLINPVDADEPRRPAMAGLPVPQHKPSCCFRLRGIRTHRNSRQKHGGQHRYPNSPHFDAPNSLQARLAVRLLFVAELSVGLREELTEFRDQVTEAMAQRIFELRPSMSVQIAQSFL